MNSLLNVWQLLGWTMILFLAGGNVVFLIGGAVRMILQRANAHVRYASSLITFAVLAILPLAIAGYLATNTEVSRGQPTALATGQTTNPMRQRGEKETTKETNHTNRELNAEFANLPPLTWEARFTEATRQQESSSTAAPTADAIKFDFTSLLNHFATYLPWLWVVGTPLTFLLLATGLIGAERLRSSCQIVNDGPIRAACDELRAALGISRQVGVAVCERIATPLLVGVAKPLILLPPAALTGWTTAELEMVLVHELAHVRRWDNAVNLAQRIVESLLFFHPAVWIVSGWVRRDREDCCDAVVVRHTAAPQAYAELLLTLASHIPGLATSVAMAQHPLAGRVRRILKLEDEPMLVTRKGLFVGVSAVVVAAFLAFALPTTDAEETVSREAERVGDERASTTNPTRQRGEEQAINPTRQRGEEQTTKDTNNTKEELNAEAAEKAEDAKKNSNKDSVQYIVVYPLDDNEADIKSWLKALDIANEIHLISKDGKDLVAVTGTRKEHEKVSALLQSKRPEASRQRPENTTEINAEAAKNAESPLFPTLEEQRAADVAYKLLGVELEKLTPEELERVNAKGYKGGLKATGKWGGRFDTSPLVPGDLLVGLHVWPTESLQQVNEILTRDDLDQLSPLKFYVIRRSSEDEGVSGGGMGAAEAIMVDKVITGRESVDLDAWRELRGETKAPQPSISTNVSGESAPLLYDGKTFDEWRNLWKTELKTEKRIECIKALAAFGRAGKGQEAAEAILDVAAEYDFGRGKGDSATDLKSAITEVLTGYDGIEGQYWLPLLIERLKPDPDKWTSFAGLVLTEVSVANTLGYLKQMAADDSLPADARNAALACISSHPEVAEDADALQMVREALLKDPPVKEIFNKLRFDRMDLFPQQVELLLDKDNAIRHRAIASLEGPLYRMASIPILNELLKVIDDPNRAADHAGAISAIASLGLLFDNVPDMRKRRQEVDSRLAKILIEGDEELLAVTLRTMSTLSRQPAEDLVKRGSESLGDKLSDERREALKKAAKQVKEWTSGDGGMGGGGAF